MCGRYVSATPPDAIAGFFDVDLVAETLIEPNFNVAPTASVPVVRERHEQRSLEMFHWGLLPHWAKDRKIGASMINARAETLAVKNAFKRSFTKRRCIIPADSFYEWTTIEAPVPPESASLKGTKSKQPKKAKPIKQPWNISTIDGSMMAFAGLYAFWSGPDGDEEVLSCTIITTTANERISPVHDRMPVLLAPDAWEQWLDPDFQDIAALQPLLVPAPSELFRVHPVSTMVNNARNGGAHLIDEVDLPPVAEPVPSGPEQGTLL